MVNASELVGNANFDVYQIMSDYLGVSVKTAVVILAVIAVWSLVWKGLALWKSSKKNNLIWFIILLVVNTVGILEILYIFVFSKISFKGKRSAKPKAKKKKK